MSFKNFESEDKVVYVELSGSNPDQWKRVGETLVGLLEKLSSKIDVVSGIEASSSGEVAKDISKIANRWAKEKLDAPSLQNDSLKADILKKMAEAERTRSEAHKINSEIRNKEVLVALEAMERLIEIQQKMSLLGIEIHKAYPQKMPTEVAANLNNIIPPAADSGC
ncbi:hypothetical protein D0C16_10240 [Cellvibrio sp. KY-GH-1]|uniref:hypothetical protein n=1 Tax=Cellvibrio sp. KY-GH-1 TaxID=2303332 RepID=UPI001245BD2F|nr:hypothetical protein [Cellvibrio sp. KY-GH-1]QEY16326.1 hypothetical protein D0C16_10240 [Cellvibrio sp. KY-GH-1]